MVNTLSLIVLSGTPQHAATIGQWDILKNGLAPYARTRDVYLNLLGEKISKSPAEIASLIRAGAVWVDYCGWPMYGYGGSLGFVSFLQSAGIAQPSAMSFDANVGGYVRALSTQEPLAYPWIRNQYANDTLLTPPMYVYPSFAIRIGNGAYCYAFGNDGQAFNIPLYKRLEANQITTSMPTQDYLPFIEYIIRSLPAASSGGTGGRSAGGGGVVSVSYISPPSNVPRYVAQHCVTLQQGAKSGPGGDIALVQLALAYLGYQISDQLGTFGPSTAASIRTFQGRIGIQVNGVMNTAFYAALSERLASSGGYFRCGGGNASPSPAPSGGGSTSTGGSGTSTGGGSAAKTTQPQVSGVLIAAAGVVGMLVFLRWAQNRQGSDT